MTSTPEGIKPLALTMGDACGIGPEILAKAFRGGSGNEAVCGAFVLGDLAVMRRAAALTGGMLPVALIEHPSEALACPRGCLPVLQVDGLPGDLIDAPFGAVDARAGAAAATCIRAAVACALAGEAAGIVTAPIHKEALAAAGVDFPGHTEMLQAWAGAGAVRMMLANDEIKVVLVTIHMSLRRADRGRDLRCRARNPAHRAARRRVVGAAHAAHRGCGAEPARRRGRLVRRRGDHDHRPGHRRRAR